ncbi:uncharacterized protein LOC108226364 [Daucus carota subsp. sativus]|uniref:uncharacterized protein LOC108226364 n=1 Tax=Daucus carota subsp. sativus TaxID=79200 RepID=UPI0007EF52BB|nr:PREDICTED: nuclear transcription factor Y subunit gamma-like [Daucus carota subsp. sativus]
MDSHQQYIADQDADQEGNNPPPLPDTTDVVASNSVLVSVLPVYQEIQAQAQHMENVREQLRRSWANQMQELTRADLKKHSLPLAPIKRIMKADNDIRMIAQEALPLFAKACEMFIVDMTSQAWIVTEEDKRRTVQKNDIVEAVLKTNMFDFLDNIIPRDEVKKRILKAKNARQGASSSTDSGSHGNNASSVTRAVVQQPPPFVPLFRPVPQIPQSFLSVPQSQQNQETPFIPWPQGHQIPEQHLPIIPWPQAQQHLYQQTPIIPWPQTQQTPEQHLPIIPWPQAQQHLYQPWPQIQQIPEQHLSFIPCPQTQHHQDQQPSLFPWPQTQQIPEQHLSLISWPQSQQLLDQQTPEQPLISSTQAEQTTDQHTSQHFPASCILPEQSPEQQNLEQSSLQAEQQQDQQN